MTSKATGTGYALPVGCAQIKGTRDEQEDYFALPPFDDPAFMAHAGQIYVLSDGMGGHEGGAAASLLAVRLLLNAYGQKTPDEPVADALLRSVRTANDSVYELAQRTGAGNSRGMGATLIAAVIHGNGLFWTSVGDSSLFLFRDGQLARLNILHRYADELDERVSRGDLSEEKAASDPKRHMLMSYLGLPNLPKVDCPDLPQELLPGDRVILASDGLSDALSVSEIAAIAAIAKEPNQCAEALLRCVHEKACQPQDNTTVVVTDYRPHRPADNAGIARPSGRSAAGNTRPGKAGVRRFAVLMAGALAFLLVLTLVFWAGVLVGKRAHVAPTPIKRDVTPGTTVVSEPADLNHSTGSEVAAPRDNNPNQHEEGLEKNDEPSNTFPESHS